MGVFTNIIMKFVQRLIRSKRYNKRLTSCAFLLLPLAKLFLSTFLFTTQVMAICDYYKRTHYHVVVQTKSMKKLKKPFMCYYFYAKKVNRKLATLIYQSKFSSTAHLVFFPAKKDFLLKIICRGNR